jgi:CHC2 zinc finger
MNIDNLLSRLEKVKPTGKDEYKACCPHHADKSPSLSIKELPDGRILINCFAGCAPLEILNSVGLSFSDLFPEPLGEFKSEKRAFSTTHSLKIIGFETTVILACASILREGKELTGANYLRLVDSISRIQSILRICGL